MSLMAPCHLLRGARFGNVGCISEVEEKQIGVDSIDAVQEVQVGEAIRVLVERSFPGAVDISTKGGLGRRQGLVDLDKGVRCPAAKIDGLIDVGLRLDEKYFSAAGLREPIPPRPARRPKVAERHLELGDFQPIKKRLVKVLRVAVISNRRQPVNGIAV